MSGITQSNLDFSTTLFVDFSVDTDSVFMLPRKPSVMRFDTSAYACMSKLLVVEFVTLFYFQAAHSLFSRGCVAGLVQQACK